MHDVNKLRCWKDQMCNLLYDRAPLGAVN